MLRLSLVARNCATQSGVMLFVRATVMYYSGLACSSYIAVIRIAVSPQHATNRPPMTLHINRMRDRASVVGFITYNEYTSKAGKRMAYARKDYTAMRHPLALATPRLAPDKSSNGRTHSLRKPF